MTSTFHLPPMVLARVFSPEECQEMIDFAETQMWNVEKDSVDDHPAWELEVLATNAGQMAAARLHQRIGLVRPEIKIQKYALYIRKYAADARPDLAPHEDRSLVSFTAALNDSFQGGAFFSIARDGTETEIPLTTGDAVVFGGNVLHGIRPVHSGTRYSIVMHCL